MVSIGASSVPHDIQLKVLWKRGPETSTSQAVDFNQYTLEHDMGDVFTKVSSFYSKDGLDHISSFWEKKDCQFIIDKVDGGESIQIAKQEINMSQYVEK